MYFGFKNFQVILAQNTLPIQILKVKIHKKNIIGSIDLSGLRSPLCRVRITVIDPLST